MNITARRTRSGATAVDAPAVHVLMDRCAGCQECIIRCPTNALHLDPVTWTAVAEDALCVGCRQCVRTCPFAAIVVEGPQVVAPRVPVEMAHPEVLTNDRSETRQPLANWTDVLAEANRCLGCPDPTCVRGCPAHNDIPGFINAIRDGDLDEAHRVLRRTSVLPDICSRVCDQALQCEGACSWSLAGGVPVAIGALERFVADNAPVPPIEPGQLPGVTTGSGRLEVAIIGSGPAGMAAAAELVSAGATVTVFERDEEPGGLCRWGIPDFTLPDAPARRPWRDLQAAGVELRTGYEVGSGDLDRLTERYDAVVVATGASVPLRPPLDGADLDGVWDATNFLKAAHAALATGSPVAALAPRTIDDGRSATTRPAAVLVLGAGNTAMDVARSARRLGAEACCVDWMDRRFAPVRPDELAEAEAEGVEIRFSTTAMRIDGPGGHVGSVELAATRQRGAADRPEILPDDVTVVNADLVVMAMGYRIEPDLAEAGCGVPIPKTVPAPARRRWQASGLLANPAPPFARRRPIGELALGRDQAVSIASLPRRQRTWFAGDALVGPSTVVEAMAQGKAVAQAICHHRPQRAGRRSPDATRVLVVTESKGGTTRQIGDTVATHLRGRGVEARSIPMSLADPEALAWADGLVVGTWVEGAVVARVGPARAAAGWLATLPPIPGMPVGLFCTYAFSPKSTLSAIGREIEGRGGCVVAQSAFGRGGDDASVAAFSIDFVTALTGRPDRPDEARADRAAISDQLLPAGNATRAEEVGR